MSDDTTTATTTTIYNVLYYKRVAAGKVHRDKNVSKMDGILRITDNNNNNNNCNKSVWVTLTPAMGDTSDDSDSEHDKDDDNDAEEEFSKKLSWNERRKRQRTIVSQKKRSGPTTAGSSGSSSCRQRALYSGLMSVDTTTLANPLPEDTILVLGGWQVQIGSRRCPNSRSDNQNNNCQFQLQQQESSAVASVQRLPLRKPAAVARTLLKSQKTIGSKLVRSTGNSSSSSSSNHNNNHNCRNTILPTKRIVPGVTNRTAAPTDHPAAKPAGILAPLQQQQQPHPTAQPRTLTKLVSRKRPLLVSTQNHAVGATNNITSNPKSRRPILPTVRRVRPLHNNSNNNNNAITTTTAAATAATAILPHIPLPASIRSVLRPHQITGVDFLYRTLTQQGGCILGDEMGLGVELKTLMTIACLAALHRRQREKQFVVVCPSSLVQNWAAEFDKWLGRASQPKRVVISKGSAEGLQQIKAYTSSMKQLVQLKNHAGQVLIVSYDLFRRHAEQFVFPAHVSVGMLVVDEGHRLKSTTGSQTLTALESLSADARLCITATPIQNNLQEFYAIANFCCPGILGDMASFRKDFERPIATANQKNATREQLAYGLAQSKQLETMSKTFMLRRLQKDVLKSMIPPRTEALLFCRPSSLQCQLYRELTESYRNTDTMTVGSMADALTALTSLRKICSHPFLYQQDDHTLAAADPAAALSLSGKLVVLDALLQQIRERCPEDKVVIVSNFTSALSLIESLVLQPRNLAFSRLDGTTDTQNRQTLVDTFNRASPINNFCFLLSSKAGGVGLNLVGGNKLVMFDADWNPSTDVQAMGRVYRQGQTKPCTIYRFFSAGTVEEVIYQRQSQKCGLSTLTVDGTSNGPASSKSSSKSRNNAKFSKEELRDCFTLKLGCNCDTKDKIGRRWPDYTGPPGLDCTDEPLLAVAESMSAILCHVHIVSENDDCAAGVDPESDSESSGSDNGHHADDCLMHVEESSESENEF